jgi:hypothetical protein
MYSDKDREIQRKMMESKMQRIDIDVDRARIAAATGRVAEVDRIVRNVRGQLQDKAIAREYFAKVSEAIKAISLDANMKLVDTSLEQAREFALQRLEGKKQEAVKIAKEHMLKAMELGAAQTFKDLVLKKIDLISMTGGHRQEGPSKAKPAEAMPKIANVAKGEKRNYTRFSEPKLQVKLADKVFTTIDWSIGGLLIANYDGDLDQGGETQANFCLVGGDRNYTATIRVVRLDSRHKTLAVRFTRSTMDALEFFRNLMKQHAQRAV